MQPTASGAKVEVIEFFYYGCPGCNSLQAPLSSWLKKKPADVEFRRAPVVFQDSWLPLTTAYYAFDAMGLVDKLQGPAYSTSVGLLRWAQQESQALLPRLHGKKRRGGHPGRSAAVSKGLDIFKRFLP